MLNLFYGNRDPKKSLCTKKLQLPKKVFYRNGNPKTEKK